MLLLECNSLEYCLTIRTHHITSYIHCVIHIHNELQYKINNIYFHAIIQVSFLSFYVNIFPHEYGLNIKQYNIALYIHKLTHIYIFL